MGVSVKSVRALTPCVPALSGREIWERVSQRLARDLSQDAHRAWIAPLKLLKTPAGAFVLVARNSATRDGVRRNHFNAICELWAMQAPGTTVSIVTAAEADALRATSEPDRILEDVSAVEDAGETGADRPGANLRADHTFETLVVGSTNEVAAAVGRRIASGDAPGGVAVFYGPHGVGKTHLLHAVGHMAQRRGRRVRYMTAEAFLSSFVTAVRANDAVRFKEEVRGVDLLLLDDLQFLAGKATTQEEFFHCISALSAAGASLICSADVAPGDIERLDERVRARLKGGVIQHIGLPDAAMRRAIVARKAALLAEERPGFVLPDSFVTLIADTVRDSGRALEGVVNKIFVANAWVGREVSVALVQEAMADIRQTGPRKVGVELIQKRVAAHFDLPLADLLSARRLRTIVLPRQVAMYLCKKLTPRSFPDIARRFGGKDHTTVMYAVRKIEGMLAEDTKLAADVSEIERGLLN